MLVITRKDRESILIDIGQGEVVEICMVESRQHKAVLAINAPARCLVIRAELDAQNGGVRVFNPDNKPAAPKGRHGIPVRKTPEPEGVA